MTWNRQQAENRKKKLAERRAKGLCVGCGADAKEKRLCRRCADLSNRNGRRRRRRKLATGLCGECGKKKITDYEYRCNDCHTAKYGTRECKTVGCKNKPNSRNIFCEICKSDRAILHWWINISERNKVCAWCGRLFLADTRLAKCCSDDCLRRYYTKRATVKWRKRNGKEKSYKICIGCGVEFDTWDSRKKTCGHICSKKVSRRLGKQMRRHRSGSERSCFVDIKELFKRDLGRCKICNRKLNLKRVVPHRLAATVDHIVPLSLGGINNYENTQLACFICNSSKGNRAVPGGEQLLMIGL